MGFTYNRHFEREFKRQVETNTRATAEAYQEDLRRTLDVPPGRSGKMYKEHQASAPGEPPAPRTRDLIKSISVSHEAAQRNSVSSYVYSPLPYSIYLELGAPKINLDPRPAWVITIYKWKEKYAQMMTKGFRRI